jgi:hypothetical protein
MFESCGQSEESSGFIKGRTGLLVGRLLPPLEEQITMVSVTFRMKYSLVVFIMFLGYTLAPKIRQFSLHT